MQPGLPEYNIVMWYHTLVYLQNFLMVLRVPHSIMEYKNLSKMFIWQNMRADLILVSFSVCSSCVLLCGGGGGEKGRVLLRGGEGEDGTLAQRWVSVVEQPSQRKKRIMIIIIILCSHIRSWLWCSGSTKSKSSHAVDWLLYTKCYRVLRHK